MGTLLALIGGTVSGLSTGHLSPELRLYFLVIMGVVACVEVLFLLSKRPTILTLLHEGAHIAYALSRGVRNDQVELDIDTLDKPVISLNMTEIPKGTMLGILLFPLVFPLGIALPGIFFPSFRLTTVGLAMLAMAGSAADIAYAAVIWRTPGDFVTATKDEIVIR